MALDGVMINGAAAVWCGTGTNNALELMGYTRDGVDVRKTNHVHPIITDVFGPELPQDWQDVGESFEINCPMIVVDRTVLAKITSRGDRTAWGQLNTPGMVIGASGYAFRVGIASPADQPYSFTKCIIRPGWSVKLATTNQPLVIPFYAGPFAAVTTTSAKDIPIVTRSLA